MARLAERFIKTYWKIIDTEKKPGRRIVQGEKVCFYCGEPMTEKNRTIDHVMPTSRGGVDWGFNQVEACSRCNTRKNGTHPSNFFIEHMESLPDKQVIEFLARFVYHELVTEKAPPPEELEPLITAHTEGWKVYE